MTLAASGHSPRAPSGYTTGMSELVFFKSSYSSGSGNCVEAAFRKSSYSLCQTECVEVADLPTGTAIRDTQNRELGHLDIPRAEWAAFLRTAT